MIRTTRNDNDFRLLKERLFYPIIQSSGWIDIEFPNADHITIFDNIQTMLGIVWELDDEDYQQILFTEIINCFEDYIFPTQEEYVMWELMYGFPWIVKPQEDLVGEKNF